MKNLNNTPKTKHSIASSLVAGLMLLGASTLGHANTAPAQFNFEGEDISQKITRETLPKNALNIAIYCQSVIDSQGENLSTACFEKGRTGNLEQQVEQAISQLDFKPAILNNESVGVRMNFRVVYQQDETSKTVMLVPNLGSLQSTLGINYSEPQELLAQGWFNQLKNLAPAKTSFFKHNSQITRASALITQDGSAKNVNVIDNTNREAAKQLTQAITNAAFIPGHINGKPTSMKYLAIVTAP